MQFHENQSEQLTRTLQCMFKVILFAIEYNFFIVESEPISQ